MSSRSRNLAVIAAVACSLVPATAVHAQRYSSDPRPASTHTYKAQPQRPHTLKVAPNTHVTRRPPHRESQRALIEELQRRIHAERKTTSRRKIVRDRPAVIAPRRVVVDSPRVIERRRVDYDSPRVIERRRAVYEPTRVIERRRVVYEPPRVIEPRRVVYGPPQVIERSYIVEACPTRRGLFQPGRWFGPGYYCRCDGY